jgi:hypothetical protein
MPNQLFIDYLKSQMDERGIGVKELADELNITQATIYYWLRGNTSPTRHRIITRLADLFKEDCNSMLLLVNNPKPDNPLLAPYRQPRCKICGKELDEHGIGFENGIAVAGTYWNKGNNWRSCKG